MKLMSGHMLATGVVVSISTSKTSTSWERSVVILVIYNSSQNEIDVWTYVGNWSCSFDIYFEDFN